MSHADWTEAQGFYAYVRKSDEWVVVHRARCRFPLSMNTANGTRRTSNTGFWIGPYATRSEAFDNAQDQGATRIRGCTYCKP